MYQHMSNKVLQFMIKKKSLFGNDNELIGNTKSLNDITSTPFRLRRIIFIMNQVF